jgi:hypothetical protein
VIISGIYIYLSCSNPSNMKSFFYLSIFLFLFVFPNQSSAQAECGDSVVVIETNSTSIYGSFLNKSITIFDSSGNLKTRTYMRFEGGIWKNYFRNSNLYDSAENIIEELNLETNDFGGWDTSSVSFNTYNSNGDMTESIYMTNWNGPLENASKTTYSYDNFFNLIEQVYYSWQNSAWSNNHRYLYYPDANGNDTLTVSENGDTTTWSNYERTFSFYNGSNQRMHDSVLTWISSQMNWVFIREDYFSYSATQLDSALFTNYNVNGSLNSSTYDKYQYDSLNRQISIDYYNWNNSYWNYSYSDSTQYDVWGNIIRSIGDAGTFDWVYDSVGNLLHYDAIGPAMSPYSEDYSYNGTVRTGSTFMSFSQSGDVTTGSSTYYYAFIEGNEFTCGQPVQLFAIPCSPNHQYLWSNGSTDQSITVMNQGSINLTVTFPGGYVATAAPMHVHASSAPQLDLGNDTTVCYNETILLDANSGYAYNWNDGSQLQTLLAQSGVPDSNYYSVLITDTNGCTANDTILIVFDNCLQVENNEYAFSFYPNPANEYVKIHLTQAENATLEVLDMMGKERMKFENVSGDFRFSIEKLSTGIYFLKLNDSANSRTSTQKLIVNIK